MNNKSCSERIAEKLDSRIEDLKKLWDAYCSGDEDVEEFGNIYDYGLSIDYVRPDDEPGYLRYLLSWGGPADEFRFYLDPDYRCYCIEYAFLDWYDEATIKLSGDNKSLMLDIYKWFHECGIVEHAIKESRE